MSYEFDVTAADGIDQSAIKNVGPQFPLVQFRKGDQGMRKAGGMEYEGGFFIPDDKGGAALSDALEAAGWKRESFISESEQSKGTEVMGWWKKQITIAIVLDRGKWIETEKNGKKSGYSKDQYLVFIKDLEDHGLFQMTFSGHAAMSFKGVKNYYKTGVLSNIARTLVAPANAISAKAGVKSQWARFAFWVTVGAAEDAKHQPVFTTAGSGADSKSIVLPVPFGLPSEPGDVDKSVLGKFFVGPAFLKIANEAFKENESWKEWPTNEEDSNGDAAHDDSHEAPQMDSKALKALGV